MPKIAVLSNRENSAISHVLTPMAKAIGAELHYYPFKDMDSLEDYDLVHIGYIGLVEKEWLNTFALSSINVWNISIQKISAWANDHWTSRYDHFVVDDTTTFQTLGQLGVTEMSLIPLAFDHRPFQTLPVPDEDFTVGVFCNDYPSKRYDVVFEACRRAKVRCFCQVLDSNRTHYSIDPVRDVYRRVHVLAHASYTDTNSMPVHEALLCGRPVITTHNFGVHRFVREGLNGYFFNGSIDELVEKILLAKENYVALRAGAITKTPLPQLEEAIRAYRDTFSKLLDGEQLPLMWPRTDESDSTVSQFQTSGDLPPAG